MTKEMKRCFDCKHCGIIPQVSRNGKFYRCRKHGINIPDTMSYGCEQCEEYDTKNNDDGKEQ